MLRPGADGAPHQDVGRWKVYCFALRRSGCVAVVAAVVSVVCALARPPETVVWLHSSGGIQAATGVAPGCASFGSRCYRRPLFVKASFTSLRHQTRSLLVVSIVLASPFPPFFCLEPTPHALQTTTTPRQTTIETRSPFPSPPPTPPPKTRPAGLPREGADRPQR